MSVTLLIIAILPTILIGLFIYFEDKKKESVKLLSKLFFAGVFSCFPSLIVEYFISSLFISVNYMNFIQLFFYVFFCIALVEEFFKMFFVYKISYNHNEFDSLYDMVVYASFVALGFACLENIAYVFSYGVKTGLLRAITAVPGHVCDGILMGSYLALAKINQINGDYKLFRKFFLLSILIPTITHGIYDYCVYLGNFLFMSIFVLFVILLITICFKKVKYISKNNRKFY